jgi:hypothetical protein
MPELNTVITGSNFKGKAAVAAVARLRAGDPVTVYREPQNRHDANAVAVTAFDLPIGYIPRVCNAALAAALDEGLEATAVVTEPALIAGKVIREPKLLVSW